MAVILDPVYYTLNWKLASVTMLVILCFFKIFICIHVEPFICPSPHENCLYTQNVDRQSSPSQSLFQPPPTPRINNQHEVWTIDPLSVDHWSPLLPSPDWQQAIAFSCKMLTVNPPDVKCWSDPPGSTIAFSHKLLNVDPLHVNHWSATPMCQSSIPPPHPTINTKTALTKWLPFLILYPALHIFFNILIFHQVREKLTSFCIHLSICGIIWSNICEILVQILENSSSSLPCSRACLPLECVHVSVSHETSLTAQWELDNRAFDPIQVFYMEQR